MFERFTERARQAVVLAQDEARALKHNYIGTEHILLGLLREEQGVSARVLETFDVDVQDVRSQVARIVGQGDEVTTGQIPFTPRAKKVLELSLREALVLGHGYIGTEHVLLGLLSEGEGVAFRILMDFADPESIRSEVLNVLSGAASGVPFVPKSPPVAAEVAAELERLRSEKEEAIGSQEFDRAAGLRDRERRLVRAAHDLERAWSGEPEPAAESESVPARRLPWAPPRRFSTYAVPRPTFHLFIGWLLFAAALGIGILIGWAI